MMRIFRHFIITFFLTISNSGCEGNQRSEDIVIINVGTGDRKEIASIINFVNESKPKVLAIDISFSNTTSYENDLMLFRALEKSSNLVMASKIYEFDGSDKNYDRFFDESEPVFLSNAATGFTNVIVEKEDVNLLRRFCTHASVNGRKEYHFAVQTSIFFDSLQTMKFVQENERIVDVDYRDGKRLFKKFSPQEILGGKIKTSEIKDKIVLIGFLGPGNEDKFYTPLNAELREPDMYGVEYLANIVAQVLEYN